MQNNLLKKPFYISLLLFSVTAGTYYISITLLWLNPEVLIVEDSKILNALSNNALNIGSILGFTSSGKYLRPVTDLTYLIDYSLWGSSPLGFRITNLILHGCNVVLFYFMSLLLLRYTEKKEEISFFAALIFAMHPTDVESVSWISGRADPMALFFSLLCMIFYLRSKLEHRWYLIFPASLFMTCSVLSKETGAATLFVIAAFEIYYGRSFGYERNRHSPLLFLLALVLVTGYFYFRSQVLPNRSLMGGIMGKDILNALPRFLASYGFYFKKALFPYPLNFSIDNINIVFYASIGGMLFFFFAVCLLVPSCRKQNFYLFWSFLALGPAALVSFSDAAWTPWAERYMYISLAPLALAGAESLFSRSKLENIKNIHIVLYFCCLLFALSSINRSCMFSSNERILYDSSRKSPDFLDIHVVYAEMLTKNNKLDDAKKTILSAETLPGAKHKLHYLLGYIYKLEGDYDKVEAYYNLALSEAREDKRLVTVGRNFRKDIIVSLADLETLKIEKALEHNKNVHYARAAELLIAAYEEAPDAFLLYRISKIYLNMKNHAAAREFLQRFIDGRPGEYEEIAKKLLTTIE